MRKEKPPMPAELQALKDRHGLTYEAMARPLHGVSARRVGDWVTGRRTCPPLAWWALMLEFDGVDIREAAARQEEIENIYRGRR